MENNAKKGIAEVLRVLPARQREVVARRFGLGKPEGETLAKIGTRFGITRERVRQIESAAMGVLKEKFAAHPLWSSFVRAQCAFLDERGGVARAEDFLVESVRRAAGIDAAHLALFATATGEFAFYAGDQYLHPLYHLGKDGVREARAFADAWEKFLSDKKDAVLGGGYGKCLGSFLAEKGVSPAHAESFLSVSKKVHRSPYGDVGLASWREVKPHTIRDRIYVVLKKEGKPMHFRALAERITAAGFDARRALAATVHNELIKDPRFVLVGRGIYALKEQGYEAGTAREIIKKILSARGALNSRDVITTVGEKWFFKPNTILVNLQNRAHFERMPDGRYRVREA